MFSVSDPIHPLLASVPQVVSLLSDASWEQVPLVSETDTPPPVSADGTAATTTENEFLHHTLHTSRALIAGVSFRHRATHETRMFLALGHGCDGNHATLHGGMSAVLLDEATGTLALHLFRRSVVVTAEMTVRYRRRLATPRVIVARSWAPAAIEGRKVRIEGALEDLDGTVYATASALFVKLDQQKL